MTEHAKLSPSSASRWLTCPGSLRVCADIADAETEYAALGTFAHQVAGDALEFGKPIEAFIGVAETHPQFGLFSCDSEMVEHLRLYVDAVNSTVDLLGLDRKHDLAVETKVHAAQDVWGTADAIVWDDDEIHVFDLKYGAGTYVEVVDNPQLMIYALGAILHKPSRCANLRRVSMHIVQPRYGGATPWRTHTIPAHELNAWAADVLLPGVGAVREPDAPLVPSASGCKWCPAKPTCPALRETALQTARNAFAAKPDPSQLTTPQLGEILAKLPVVEEWISAVRNLAYTRALESGGHKCPPGFKLIRKRGNRAWVDEVEAKRVLAKHFVNPMAEPKLISPAQAEKKIGAAGKKIVADLAHMPDRGLTLVPESDSRSAWTRPAFPPANESEEKNDD